MSYLYGNRRGIGQTAPTDATTLPGAEIGKWWGQGCRHGQSNPDMNWESGCPPMTKCTNITGGSEILGAPGLCMPKCISSVECPPGQDFICDQNRGVCVNPPHLRPPPKYNLPPSDGGGCPSWRSIPIFINGQYGCMDPDAITDDQLRQGKSVARKRLYIIRDLSVGRLGTAQDIEDVRINKTVARMSPSERQIKYNLMTNMVRNLARLYESVRKANEIAVMDQDTAMITQSLLDEKTIRNQIQVIREAQLRLRYINIIETDQGIVLKGMRRPGVQGLGEITLATVGLVLLATAGVSAVLYGLGYGMKELFFDTPSVEEKIALGTKIKKEEYDAYTKCKVTNKNLGLSVEQVLAECANLKPRSMKEIMDEIDKNSGSTADKLVDSLSGIMKLAAIGAVGYIAVPLIKDLVDSQRAKLKSGS